MSNKFKKGKKMIEPLLCGIVLGLVPITLRLNDKEIIKQVTGGLTPPMPSFEIDPVNMSNLLKYLHSLE